jgi:hypothetical protein
MFDHRIENDQELAHAGGEGHLFRHPVPIWLLCRVMLGASGGRSPSSV